MGGRDCEMWGLESLIERHFVCENQVVPPKDPMERWYSWRTEVRGRDRDLDHNLITSPLAFQRSLFSVHRVAQSQFSLPERLSHPPPLRRSTKFEYPIGHGAFVDPRIRGERLRTEWETGGK